MKKLFIVISLLLFGAALAFVPIMATAHEAQGVRRSVGGCDTLPPSQHRACRDCLNRGGGHHYHPNTGTCHQNRRPPRKGQ